MSMPIKPILSLALIAGISLSSTPAYANSLVTQGQESSSVAQNDLSEAEIDQLAADLEELFSNGFDINSDSSFTVDETAILNHFGEVQGKEIINQLPAPQAVSENRKGATTLQKSYGECVLNYTGFGLIFGAAEGTILGYINEKQWRKAAESMAKFLGKQAIKGGVVGLAASLAAGGAWCLTPWSR